MECEKTLYDGSNVILVRLTQKRSSFVKVRD